MPRACSARPTAPLRVSARLVDGGGPPMLPPSTASATSAMSAGSVVPSLRGPGPSWRRMASNRWVRLWLVMTSAASASRLDSGGAGRRKYYHSVPSTMQVLTGLVEGHAEVSNLMTVVNITRASALAPPESLELISRIRSELNDQ